MSATNPALMEYPPRTAAPVHATQNPCRLCAPLGAALVFAGVRRALLILHGSQGCATYIRRYLISHFREPLDIASSSFGEDAAIFGGKNSLREGMRNLHDQYHPDLIAVATTCLAETLGDDTEGIVREYLASPEGHDLPPIVTTSTPSYSGSHIEGFRDTLLALIRQTATGGEPLPLINVLAGMVSPEDLRYLKEIFSLHEVGVTLLPDYSETLDGGSWSEYHRMPEGGTPLDAIRDMGRASATIEFGLSGTHSTKSAGHYLKSTFGVGHAPLPLPMGIRNTDLLMDYLAEYTGKPTPVLLRQERARLVDALVDAHKYIFKKRAAVIGDDDFVLGMANFLTEIGVTPIICASGANVGLLRAALSGKNNSNTLVLDDSSQSKVAEAARSLRPDFIVGSSKCYPLARELAIPHIRAGFPIHDRIGGQRILHLGYRGATRMLDTLVNTLLDARQEQSDIGYSYL